MLQTNTEQMPQVLRKWPDATLKRNGKSEYAPATLRVPGVRLPDGWSPTVVTLLIETPPGFPGASPLPYFDTDETVMVLGYSPHHSVPLSSVKNRKNGTRFKWRVQAWNPSNDGLHTIVRVCLRRFWSAEEEVSRIRDLRETLENAAEDWGRAYEAYDRQRRGGR